MSQPPSSFRPGEHLEILDDPIHDPYQARLKLTSPTVCREHPLQRIMAIEPADGTDGALRISTTDPHLARELGRALESGLHVQAGYTLVKGTHLLRVDLKT